MTIKEARDICRERMTIEEAEALNARAMEAMDAIAIIGGEMAEQLVYDIIRSAFEWEWAGGHV